VDLAVFEAVYRRNQEAFNNRDLDTAYGWLPQDFEWYALPVVLPPHDTDMLVGPDEVREAFAKWLDEWDWRAEPEEFIDPGDGTIVVRCAGSLRGPKTGMRSTYRYMQVWELAPEGRPLRVRERLDSVAPPA
jgi:ketosteroid isomerase-like protein